MESPHSKPSEATSSSVADAARTAAAAQRAVEASGLTRKLEEMQRLVDQSAIGARIAEAQRIVDRPGLGEAVQRSEALAARRSLTNDMTPDTLAVMPSWDKLTVESLRDVRDVLREIAELQITDAVDRRQHEDDAERTAGERHRAQMTAIIVFGVLGLLAAIGGIIVAA